MGSEPEFGFFGKRSPLNSLMRQATAVFKPNHQLNSVRTTLERRYSVARNRLLALGNHASKHFSNVGQLLARKGLTLLLRDESHGYKIKWVIFLNIAANQKHSENQF
jgi:hypothetical protein